MWAKQPKRFFNRPQVAMMMIYMVCVCVLSLAAFAEEPGVFSISQTDAEAKISDALAAEGLGDSIKASITGRTTQELIKRTEPVMMEISHLNPDVKAGRFTATLTFSTEAALDKPAESIGTLQVSGRFDQMQDVPTVKFRMTSSNIITAEDIAWQKMPSARLDRETVLSAEDLIGKSPVRMLAANRPIKTADLQNPPVIVRQSTIYMNYKSPHISIQAVGTALEDGAVGDKVRVRNNSSGNVLEAFVTAPGQVQVIPAPGAMHVAVARTPDINNQDLTAN